MGFNPHGESRKAASPTVTHLTAQDREDPRLRVAQPSILGEISRTWPGTKIYPLLGPPPVFFYLLYLACWGPKVDSILHTVSPGPQRAERPFIHGDNHRRTDVSVTHLPNSSAFRLREGNR